MARTVYEAAAAAADVGAVILELARSEQTYTFQRPIDYATSVLAGAIAAGWQGPVFIQGDHYQFNAKKYAADPEAMTEEIRRACRLAIDAGYRNIDIDSSTLVDLSKPNVDEEQRENYRRAAELTALIRTLETDGVTVSVGGEIGEVGNAELDRRGAARLPRWLPPRARRARARRQGHLQGQRPDRDVARRRAAPRRRRGRGQARLRGPARARRRRPRIRAGRRRPARRVDPARRAVPSLPGGRDRRDPPRDRASRTRSYEHPAFPEALHREIEAWCFANAADERKPGQTDQQFVYTTRKKAIGPFKRQLWDLETKDEILAAQRRKISYLFTELRGQRLAPDGRPVRPPGRAPPADPRRAQGGRRRRLKPALTARRAVLSSRAGPRRRSRDRRGSSPASQRSPCVNSRGQLAPDGAVGGGDLVAGPGVVPRRTSPRATTPICDRWASSPSCRRTLGFLSNFAVAFSFISVSTGTFTNQAVALRRRRPGVLLGVAARHPRPDVRRPELRRAGEPLPGRRLDLPVVEAPVEPDARLVHRLVLLLGRGRHRHRGRGDGAARPLDDLSRPDQARRSVAGPGPRHAVRSSGSSPCSRRR